MRQKSEDMRFRVEPRHIEKMRQIKAQTGIGASELLRRMIEQIEIAPIDAKVILSTKANSDTTLAGNGVAVRA